MDMDMEEEHTTTTLVQRHPLLLCFLFFLGFLYTFLYPIFVFLLASSPVLLLTAFLLGIVLLHSVPQHEHDHHHHHHVHKKITRPPQSQTTTLTVPAPARRRPSPSTSSSSDSDQDNPPAASLAMSTATSLGSFPDATGDDDSSEDSDLDNPQAENHHHHQRSKDLLVRGVAWTADDMKSIENIGSLELERNATVEKVMSERLNSPRHPPPQQHRRGHVAAWKKSNPFDLDDEDFPVSAPSMPSPNPFFDDEDNILPLHHAPQPGPGPGPGAAAQVQAQAQQKNAMLFRRHESFTVGAPHASDFRPSRFRPYFAIDDKMQQQQGQPVAVPGGGGGKISPSSSSSSSSSFSAGANAYTSVSAHNKQEEEAAEQEKALAEAEAAAILEAKTDDHPPEMFVVRPREVVALDVELISDSSDEDISLPEPMMKVQEQQQQQHVVVAAAVPGQDDEDDEGESFEVESITKQVAAAAEGKGKQLDPAVYGDYNPSAGTGTGTVEEKKALPPLAPPSMAQIKLASMRRVFSEEDADEPMAAPSGLEDTTTLPKEEQDMFPLPPLPESAAAAGAAPPLASAAKKGVGKSVKYKPPSKKAVMGFFQGKGKA